MQSILIVSEAYLRDQIKLHGDEAHPINGGLECDLGNDLEILIRKMPQDPEGLDWSELQDVVAGLWDYIVDGMRYRAVTFDVLDIEDDAQIGWGHIVAWERGLLPNRTAKRDLQISTPAPPSSANPTSGQRNSSLPTVVGSPVEWPVEDSDMTLKFTSSGTRRSIGQALDPEAVKNLFVVVIEIIQSAIAAKGEDAILGGTSFRYGRLVVLEVINSPHMLTWGQLALVVLGLVDFMVDHDHNRSYYFTVFVGDPKVEIGIGKVVRGLGQYSNITVARRIAVDGSTAD